MLARMTARQLEEWKAFWELEPFGDEWRQTGVLAAAVTQPYTKKPIEPETFMPATRGMAINKAVNVWNKVTDFFKRKAK